MKYTAQPKKAAAPAKQAPLKVMPRQGKKVGFKRPTKGQRADRIAQAEPISKRELERIAREYVNRGVPVKRPLTELERIAESYIRKPSPSKLDRLAEAYMKAPAATRAKLPSPNILNSAKKTHIGELVKKKSAQLSKANLERIAKEYLNRGKRARGKRPLTRLEEIAEEYLRRPTKSKLDKLAEAYLRHVASKRVGK
jgi:histone H3/H4